MGQVFAAADIGSNTVHLLVASASKDGFRRIVNESEWLSLGEIVADHGEFPAPLVQQLLDTLSAYKETAKRMKAESFYVFATEAMRRAKNHEDVLRQIKKTLKIDVDLISPRREAELGLSGALLDFPQSKPVVLAETGGGSVQVVNYDGHDMGESWSLPLGSGHLIAKTHLTMPATEAQLKKLHKLVMENIALSEIPHHAPAMLACGGVARGIWRALHPDGERTIYARELEHLIWDLPRLTLPQIEARYGVKTKRAATLLPGSVVYLQLMHWLSCSQMNVSVFGVREGAIMEMLKGELELCKM